MVPIPQLQLTIAIENPMRMSCVREFVFTMLCLLASGQSIWGLTVSSQNLELDVGRSDLYNGSSSSASAGAPAESLAVPPNPFIFKAAGYTAEYRLVGAGYFQSGPAWQLVTSTMQALEERRRAAGEDITTPISGGSVQASVIDLGRTLTWEIQQSAPITEVLSYQHVEIALRGTHEVIRAYGLFTMQYSFSLSKSSSMQLVATGSLTSKQDAVTD